MRRLASPLFCPLLFCLLLAGCGFHPLYGSDDQQAEAQLPDIFVATIPGRSGQLLRQALQQRLAGTSEAEPQGYTLRVAYALDNESIAIHNDSTAARNRLVGRANWSLNSVAPTPVTLVSGNARTVDGFNNIDTQFFESTLATESTEGRIAGNLADSIRTQLAIWFAGHPGGATTEATPAQPPPKPATAPQSGYLGPQGVPADSNQSPLQQIGPDGLPAAAIGRTSP